jgi:stage II sporulation protein R
MLFEHKSKKRIFIIMICISAALIIAAAVPVIPTAYAGSPFRLHILANSNSPADQKVKLSVRDAVLKATENGIKGCKNASEAEEYIRENTGIILKTADEMLKEKGFCYQSSATVGKYRFPEKSYRGVKYPEGDYEAVRIILGEGKGDNWWCVIFPPLCLSETDRSADSVQYTSFFAELWKEVFGG